MLGDYLANYGWTSSLLEARIASSGTMDSFLKASHLARTRHAHQVTIAALKKLQYQAFLLNTSSNEESFETKMTAKCPTFQYQAFLLNTSSNEESFEAWRTKMTAKCPTFQFWDTI